MPKIGKAIFVSGGMIFDFTLTVNDTDYHFDNKSVSSSVQDVYTFDRVVQGNIDKWSLVVFVNATLKFDKIKHLCDLCAVGGGGGSGGSRAGGYGSDPNHWGFYSGAGAGGAYEEELHKTLSSSGEYTITLGNGGGGGIGGSGSGKSGDGEKGGNTTVVKGETTVISAEGGNGGGGASSSGAGSDASGGTLQYCFGDTSLPQVSGGNNASYRGGGAVKQSYHMDYYDSWYGLRGNSGAKGLFVIRSTPKE